MVTAAEGIVVERPGRRSGAPRTGRDDVATAGDGVLAEAVLDAVREVATEARPGGVVPPVGLRSRLDAELGLDSLAVVELVLRVERRLRVSLPDETLVEIQTPAQLLDAVLRAGPGDASRAAVHRPTPLHRSPATPTAASPSGAPSGAETLVELLERRAATHPDDLHLRILESDGGHEDVSYGALRHDAAVVAAGLRQRGVGRGDSVAIMLPTGREYFATFLGALYAGAVPVPLYPPGRPAALEEHLRRHVRILGNARAVVLVTVTAARRLARLIAPQLPALRHVVTADELMTESGPLLASAVSGSDTALIQYTSGSTGEPKGVVLTHANLLANIRGMTAKGGLTGTDVFVSWLPLYHDMGLIGSWLLALHVGIPFVVMSPLAFLARPERWLWALHDHGGTVSGGPNFGYELCLKRIDDAALAGLDLGGWRIAFSGAEPVSPDTVTRFAERFGHCGLDAGAITPVYGLAECSVALTVPPIGRGPVIDRVAREPLSRDGLALPAGDDEPSPARFVSCGTPLKGHKLRIVDSSGRVLEERHEGRVQFQGPSATSGYHQNPEATRRLYHDGWLDTGDLGYLAAGELHLTGRVKDLIIRAGRNLHPSELEAVVGELDGVRKGGVAVFAAADAAAGTERLVVLAETRARDSGERARLRQAVLEAAVDVVGTPPDEVVLAPPGAVPKTSSGKVRRSAARERYEAGRIAEGADAVGLQILRLAGSSSRAALSRVFEIGPRAVHGAYALVVFALLAAVVWPLVMVLPRVEQRWRLVQAAGRGLLRLTGVQLTVEGAGRLPDDRPFVAVANHASFLDPLVLALVLRSPAVFSAIEGVAANPIVRAFLARMRARLVARGDRIRGPSDVAALTEAVREGCTVVVFPEGRRAPAPGLEPFRMGAFLTAADAGVPLVPVTIRGTRRILPVGQRLPRRAPVTVVVGEPLCAPEPGWAGAVELHRTARRAILDHLDEPDLS